MKIAYQGIKLGAAKRGLIEQANIIIQEYLARGFTLTLRQLFYQFVSRALLPNTERSYKNLGAAIADGRLAGLVDWEAIEDRTRFVRRQATWESPQEVLTYWADRFRYDLWADQDNYIEVFIEKDALIGVIEGVCNELRVPYLACRGYASAS